MLGMLSHIISGIVQNSYYFEVMGIVLCLALGRRSVTRKVLQKKNELLGRSIPKCRHSACHGT